MKVLSAIAGKWMLVVACTLLGLVAAIGFSLLQSQTYVATVRTYVATGTSDMLEAYQGNQAARSSIQTFAVLATDPNVAQRAIERSGVDIAMQEFLDEISVSVPPETVVLDVSVQNPSSQDAEKLSTALAQELVGMVTTLQEPTSGGPGALRLVVVDPNTQGAVRQQLIDPVMLGVGAVGGALLGAVLALLLQLRRPTPLDAPLVEPARSVPPLVEQARSAPPLVEQAQSVPPLVEPAPSEARRRVETTHPSPLAEPAPSEARRRVDTTRPTPLVEPAPSEARRRVETTRPTPLVEQAPSDCLLVEPAPSEARRRVETTRVETTRTEAPRPAVASYTARHSVSRHAAPRHGTPTRTTSTI